MNIVHCIESIEKSTGGPARSVTHLITAMLNISSLQIELLCGESQDPVIKNFEKPEGSIQFCRQNKLGGLARFSKIIDLSNPFILHGHGLWQLPVHQMAKFAQKNKIPYIITTRGMLETWSLQQSKIKKKIAMQLYQYNDLKEATCLHATAQMEVESIRKLGFKNPIAMIPNGIQIDEFPLKKYDKQSSSTRKILFLSRIHPKKGIEILIDAWEAIDVALRKNWYIEIAGNGESEYINQLNRLIIRKGLCNQVNIVGSKFGTEKLELYQSADLFVLPTYSENFGIVIAEALSCGVPVITTKGTPWEDLQNTQSGWWIDIGVVALKFALEDAIQSHPNTLEAMGRNGRKLVEEKYSIEAVARQMLELYEWVLEKRERPEFVNIF